MTRVLIVAECPTRGSDPAKPLRSDSGRRLAKLAGVDIDRFLAPFDAVNLVDSAEFDLATATTRAGSIRRESIDASRRVVIVGRRAGAAFGLVGPPVFEWIERDGFEYAYSPHPSGKNRWWNDPENARRAEKFWRTLHRAESRAQKEGVAAERPGSKRGHASHRGDKNRVAAELEWLRDRAEDYYVETMSVNTASRALVRAHAQVCADGVEIEHEGLRFRPTTPLSRRHAYNLLRDVFARWREAAHDRIEDRRRSHHEAVAARIVQAKKAEAWAAVGRLHELLAEIDGVVGRPEERAASLQVSVSQQSISVDVYARMSDAELEHLAREALALPTATGESNPILSREVTVDARGETSGLR